MENGKIPLSLMVIRDGVYLWPSTVVRFDLFAAELVSLGYEDPRISTPLGGYRSYEAQVEAKRIFGPGAATPGYSNHGWGRAFDVNNISRYPDAIIAMVGLKHGLIRNAYVGGKLETWHFYDAAGTVPAGSTPILIEDEMGMTPEEWRQFQVLAATTNQMAAAVGQIQTAVGSLQRYIYFGGDDVKAGIGASESIFGKLFSVAVDPAPIVAAVAAALKTAEVWVDPVKIAAAVDAVLQDEFGAVPANTAKALAERLAN